MLLLLVGMFSPSASADGGAPQLAYVAGAAQGISIIDIAQRRVNGSIAVAASPTPHNQRWIPAPTSHTFFEVNGPVLGSVPIAGGPQDISSPGGFTAYVTARHGTVVAVDLSTRRVVRTLLSGGQFGSMDYDANTGEVYVPDRQHNQLDVLTPVTAVSQDAPHAHQQQADTTHIPPPACSTHPLQPA